MVPEAQLDQTDEGLVPRGEGWFVLNARESRWYHAEGRSAVCVFEGEGEADFAQLGINLSVLQPGEAMGMYHWEADQEDFLVLSGEAVLIVEGELNGMACWLARPELRVMGVAGSEGDLHLEALRGRTVNVYADGDEAGKRARERWASQAHRAGVKVYVLEPWNDGDACDVMGTLGRAALRERLL